MPDVPSKLSALVVSYYTGPCLRDCLSALLAQEALSEVIFVDNGNPAADQAYLDGLAAVTPHLTLIRPGSNLGFAKACNLAAGAASGEILLLINPDLLPPPGTIATLTATMRDHPEGWLFGGRLLNMDGSEQRGGRRDLPTPWRYMVEVLRLYRLFPAHPYFRRLHHHENEPETEIIPVSAISGAFMAIAADRWRQLGGLDERFFFHFEDVDLCFRISRQQGLVLYCGNIPIHHHLSSSDVSLCFVEWHKTIGAARYFAKNFSDTYPRWIMRLVKTALWGRFLLALHRNLPHDLGRLARKLWGPA